MEAADGSKLAKQNATLAIAEAKTWVWEDFGGVLENDFWRTLRKFWSTAQHLRKGKQCPISQLPSAHFPLYVFL